MAVTLKYFAYFGSDFTQIFTYFQIWLQFSSDFFLQILLCPDFDIAWVKALPGPHHVSQVVLGKP